MKMFTQDFGTTRCVSEWTRLAPLQITCPGVESTRTFFVSNYKDIDLNQRESWREGMVSTLKYNHLLI